jgi:hypothetical protein
MDHIHPPLTSPLYCPLSLTRLVFHSYPSLFKCIFIVEKSFAMVFHL